jgi:hypothetical protein
LLKEVERQSHPRPVNRPPGSPQHPPEGVDRLLPELYKELRRIARTHRWRRDRLHFLALSARGLRFVLIDC